MSRLLHITYPLEGKVPLTYMQHLKDNMTCSTSIDRRSLSEHTDVLGIMLGDPALHQEVVQSCATYVASFNSSYVMVKGFLGDTGQSVNSSIKKIVELAISKVRTKGRSREWPDFKQSQELTASIESIVHTGIHKYDHYKLSVCLP